MEETMEIKIDEKQLQEALDGSATAGIKNAFGSYPIKSMLEKTIADSVLPTLITSAIEKATSTMDINVLSLKLGEEIAKSVTKGVKCIIQETMIGIIMDIRKIPQYDDEKRKRAKAEIETLIFDTGK